MTTECGCTIEYGATDDVRDRIAYCSLHAAAGEIRTFIRRVATAPHADHCGAVTNECLCDVDDARALLARIGC